MLGDKTGPDAQQLAEMCMCDKQSPATKLTRDTADNEKAASDLEEQQSFPADALSTPRQILFVAIVCTAMFTNQCNLGNTLATVDIIADSFGVSNAGRISWLISGYSLTVGTFILVGGRFGDEFGHKNIFVIGLSWFAIWSLVAGLSVYSSYVLFIFARVFQGIGAALTLPNALAILGQSYSPGPRKNMAFAWFGGTAPYGAIAGFLFGGLFSLAWWPWIYWSLAIALVGVTALAIWMIPATPRASTSRNFHSVVTDLDLLGMLTGVAALVLINFAWNQAVVVTWHQSYVYICLILGLAVALCFFYIETRVATKPLLPLAVFNADIAFVMSCTALGWACFGIWVRANKVQNSLKADRPKKVFYIERVAIDIGGTTPIQIAAWFTPIVIVGLGSALAVGKLIGITHPSWIMAISQFCYLIGSILAALRPPHSVYWTYFFFSVCIIVPGMDTSFPAATIGFSNAVPREYQGMGASIVLTVINYSISLGLGFAGTIETNINRGGLTTLDRLFGYRGAQWFGVGLAGLGVPLSLLFVAKTRLQRQS